MDHVKEEETVVPQADATPPESMDALEGAMAVYTRSNAEESARSELNIVSWLDRAKAHLMVSESGALTEWGGKMLTQVFDFALNNREVISVEIARWIRPTHGTDRWLPTATSSAIHPVRRKPQHRDHSVGLPCCVPCD